MRKPKEPQWKLDDCACVVTSLRYVSMCATHQRKHDEIHERWNLEKREADAKRDADEAIKKVATIS